MKNQKNHGSDEKDSNSSNSNGHSGAKTVFGIAALAAAAAGAYFLYGSDEAVKNRKKLKSWMLRLKAEVMDEVENIKDLSQSTYDAAVSRIAEKYSTMKDVDQDELADLIKRLKGHWKDIKREIEASVDTMKEAAEVAAKTKSKTSKN